MITIKVQSVQAAAEKYMENHLSQSVNMSEGEDRRESDKSNLNEDLTQYYTDLPMKWHGHLVSKLGFDPTKSLTKAQFKSLLENKNPNTGKNLTARTIQGRRLYFDATTSAPKSVSILAVTMNDHRLIKAHEEATAFSITEIEKFAQTRVRVDGQHTIRKTGNVLCATATHTTSRTNDPQLHSHNLFFNVTWDQREQKYKALEAYEVYDKATYFTEIYRHVLAQKVKELGYQIEHKRHGWEIKGVSPEICTKFSKRSSLIKKLTHQFEQSLERALTNNEKSLITEKSRRAKSKNLTLKQAVELQQSELTLSEKQSLERIKTLSLIEQKMNENSFKSIKKISTQLNKDFETKADVDAFDFAIRHVFERKSTVSKQDLITAAIKSDYGKLNLHIIDKLIDSNQNLFRGENDLIGTVQGLSQELYISEFVEKSVDKFAEKKIQNISDFVQFTDEQKQAFHEIFSSPDQVHFLEGSAGTGKSFLLKGVSDAITGNKIPLLATAPTASAALSLEKDVGVPAQTLQSLLYNHDLFKDKLTNGYLIVDEAGFISSDQMDKLFKISEKYNTQVLLVGDTKQHHGVEAGDALRSLKLYSNIKTSTLSTVIRQKNLNYKAAINDLQNLNYTAAWDKFNQMDVVNSLDKYLKGKGQNISENDLKQSLDYNKLIQSYKSRKENGESVLVITPSRFEVKNLTQMIRSNLDLDPTTSIHREVYSSIRFTEAEKSSINSYYINDIDSQYISFQLKSENFKKNSIWKVIEKTETELILKNETTEEIKPFNLLNKNTKFDVLKKQSLEICKDDELLIQQNMKSQRLVNGDLVKVKDFINGEILLEDGRILKQENKFFDYGYVTTSYSSQGKTCDHVILSMTNASGKAISAEQFYVSTTRGRHSLDIFIESEDYIRSRIESFNGRTLNRELLNSQQRKILAEVQDKSLTHLSEALKNSKSFQEMVQNMEFDQLKANIPFGDAISSSAKKPWMDRKREAFLKLVDQFKFKIQEFQKKSFIDFNSNEKVKSKGLDRTKNRTKEFDLDL